MKLAVTCPGQGLARTNLLAPYTKYRPVFHHTLAELDETLNQKFSHNLFNHEPQWLAKTSNAQPAILSTTYIINEIIRNQFDIELVSPSTVLLGHSLGEYTALLLNQQLTLPTALKLVQMRAQLMEQLDLQSLGYRMKAIMFRPANYSQVLKVCVDNKVLANANSYQQLVLSGKESEINHTIDQINATKKLVMKTVDLPVQIPFHHETLAPIQLELESFLATQPIKPGITSVVSNLNGKETRTSADIIHNTIHLNSKPVQWIESMETLTNMGVTDIVNLGPGQVLHNINTKFPFTNHSLDTLDPDQIQTIKDMDIAP